MIEFKMNDYVRVKLTGEGIKILEQLNKETLEQYPAFKNDPDLKNIYLPKVDKNGYCTYQVWEMMSLFGKYVCSGATPPFEPKILLNIHWNIFNILRYIITR